MTVTETSDYIIIGQLASDEQIEARYVDLSNAFKENYVESSGVIEQSNKFISDCLQYSGDSAFCIAMLAVSFTLIGFHLFNAVCSALSPYERR